jgi:hypothetical protein
MPILAGILFVATGFAFMLFGLFLFYAFLPLLFAFIGFDIGMLLGRWLTGGIGWIAIMLGVVAAGILAVASYSLEPYRRILLGSSSGILAGLSLAAGLGLDGLFAGFLNLVLILAGGLIGGFLVLYVFDVFVIVTTALGGAGLVVAGAHLLLHGSLQGGIDGFWSSVFIMVLAAVGIGWQLSNISKWVQSLPVSPGISSAFAERQDKTPKE